MDACILFSVCFCSFVCVLNVFFSFFIFLRAYIIPNIRKAHNGANLKEEHYPVKKKCGSGGFYDGEVEEIKAKHIGQPSFKKRKNLPTTSPL